MFQVPEISREEWLAAAYIQPAACLTYSAMMEDYLAKNTFEPGDKSCKVAGCQQATIRFSGVCKAHHIEQLQHFGILSKPPPGRLFTPYDFLAS
ncbi:hypothetical protein J4E00_20890 [Siccationidurans soli]|uniref:Uncharacterized protein n=1 Tax=Hymenobacter negativus TaxID=2795026 RepID=A0ABS3QJV7_9BACT|nr:hypothetical protein [Hymenobacter negativus]